MLLRKLRFTLVVLAALMLSPAQAGQADGARDVRVVVDISGSMKLNDPDNLRRPAVRLLAGLLPDGTGVGLWTFGRDVNMLVPHAALDQGQRQALIDGSARINSVAQRTNIGAAIETASDHWYSPERSLTNTHLILLSDGKVDIDPSLARNDSERERILTELIPRLATEGLTIHTIALSAEADLDLLGAIADHTGGVAYVAKSADELSRIFADTLGQAVPANEIPLDNNRFTVDAGVEEFTALIFSSTAPDQRQLTLELPDGSRTTVENSGENIRWAREAGYDLITVQHPVAGEWQLDGTLGEGSRVTVVSDLRLEVNPIAPRFSPGNVPRMEAFFSEDGQRITDVDFLGVITVRLTLTREDGPRGIRILNEDQPPADGIYRDSLSGLQEPGRYQLELQADGGTFSRKFRQTLTLAAPTGDEPAVTGIEPVAEVPSEPTPAVGDPIDLSLLEEETPQETDASDPSEETSPESSLMALWPWFAGGAGLLIILALVLILLRRRQQEQASSGSETADTVAGQAPPLAESDSPGPAARVPEQQAEEGEPQPVPPVIEDHEGSTAPASGRDDLQPDAFEDSLLESEEGDEFGLEDFDLSDIDNLPDLDAEEGNNLRKRPPQERDEGEN